ncbi:MAG TPA: hypothetical protein VKN99_25085 [Polyangia bacterium]|nr:hypothetical protein [Polyangia bacterium]
MRLRVRYSCPAQLVADHDHQFVRGGLLVRVEPPPGVTLFEEVELEVVGPSGQTVVMPGQVVQLLPGVGVAVTFEPELLAALAGDVAAARAAAPQATGRPTTHEVVADAPPTPTQSPPPPEPAPAARPEAHARMRTATMAQKIQMALHGDKDERALIVRDINRSLHRYVLQNPHTGADEVLAFAKLATVSPDFLQAICDRRDWAQRQDIALALVRNPKTPPPSAVKLLDFVGESELRRLAKDPSTRVPIRQAASKKLFGS